MDHGRLLWIMVLLLGWGCRNEKPAARSPSPAREPTPEARVPVCIDGVLLRHSPGPEGAVLAELKSGDRLIDLDEVSRFVTAVELRGRLLEEPWLMVATTDGKQGWIYGGTLHFCERAQVDFLKKKRLQALFDPSLTNRIAAFRGSFAEARTAESLAYLYREALMLQPEITRQLDNRLAQWQGNRLPDLFWLEEMLPGFIFQLVSDGTAYHPFVDFRQWAKQAALTDSDADNAFFDLCFEVFPPDSIEYFFPAWTIQVWDNSGHSLLGRDVHRRLLRSMDQVLTNSDLFQPEIQQIKNELINDITRPHVTYWETREKIVRELELILAEDHPCLEPHDRVGLEIRLMQFRDPGRHSIKLNIKSGEQGL